MFVWRRPARDLPHNVNSAIEEALPFSFPTLRHTLGRHHYPQIVLRISESLPKPHLPSLALSVSSQSPFTSSRENPLLPSRFPPSPALRRPPPPRRPYASEHYTASAGVIRATFGLGPSPSAPSAFVPRPANNSEEIWAGENVTSIKMVSPLHVGRRCSPRRPRSAQ